MKKINSIRALLIALMLTFTFAIPALASVKTQAVPVEADQAVPTEPVTETASIDIAAPTSDAQDAAVETEVIDNEIDTVSEETDDVIEETAEEVVETASEVEAEDPPIPYCSYCGSEDHSYTYCAQRSIDNGAVGRWVISNAGIDVACYYYTEFYESGASVQRVTDAWDSAAYFPYNGLYIISDHSNQEFNSLKYVSVGMDAYMDYGDYQQKYVCTRFEYGYNDSGIIADASHTGIYYYDYNNGGVTCYTCNGNWQNIILVSFQPVYD